ncbi:MAG: dihydrofolate reductase family protein [Thermoleophilia bacterium]
MGRIVISENLTLDGVVEDPTGEEGFRRGGWFGRITDEDREAWTRAAFEEARRAEALLLGRRSYRFFAARWPSRSGPFADRLNALPKYVVSATLDRLDWANSELLGADVVTGVSRLRRSLDGDIVVYASFGLVDTLLSHDLADELRLTIFPIVVGEGRRLFGGIVDEKPLSLVRTATLGGGLSLLTYEL